MLRGARSKFSPRHSNMVAGNGSPGMGVPMCHPHCFPHPSVCPNHQVQPCVSYADAVMPGYGLGDPSWCVVPPCTHLTNMSERRAVFMAKKPRGPTKNPTMPYRHVKAIKPHGVGLPRTTKARTKHAAKQRSSKALKTRKASSVNATKAHTSPVPVTLNAKPIESYTTELFEQMLIDILHKQFNHAYGERPTPPQRPEQKKDYHRAMIARRNAFHTKKRIVSEIRDLFNLLRANPTISKRDKRRIARCCTATSTRRTPAVYTVSETDSDVEEDEIAQQINLGFAHAGSRDLQTPTHANPPSEQRYD